MFEIKKVSCWNVSFLRKYIPALAKFPAQYIFEPWTAPKTVQEKCGCIIGKDYPKPIVDHDEARKSNISRMAAAYARRGGGSKSGIPRVRKYVLLS